MAQMMAKLLFGPIFTTTTFSHRYFASKIPKGEVGEQIQWLVRIKDERKKEKLTTYGPNDESTT